MIVADKTSGSKLKRWVLPRHQKRASTETERSFRPSIPSIPWAQPRPRFEPPSTGTVAESTQEERKEQPVSVVNPVLVGFMFTTGVGLALLGWWAMTNVGALAGWVVGALFIALGLDPAVRRLEKLGMPRIAGVISLFALITLALTGLLSYVIPQIANQTVQLVNGFPGMFEDFLISDFFITIDNQFEVRSWVDNEVQAGFTELTGNTNVVSGFLNNLVNAGSTVATIITGTLIVLFLSLYFLSSLPVMKAWFVRLTPASRRERVAALTEKITASVGYYVMGQAIVAVCNATFALIVMLIVDAPFPQLLTLFVVILAFIPLVGGVSAGILVSLICLMNSWQTAVIFAICYFIYLQIEAYFISPRIMSKAVAVPGGVAIIAVAAGGALWGVLGALIAIPIAASLLILVKEVLVPRQDAA
ncbi:hypothetical protein GCM10007359_06000 [Rothia aerolata]|uniref:AI-2E family transporter n=1 Tax=Rothia aerolata TaxID=1812262 RepID=A0A917MR59_9MICC|nr:hypothetical protein GCM10007359_06000 [Rothia aerolata]